jgi:hypothetical protein
MHTYIHTYKPFLIPITYIQEGCHVITYWQGVQNWTKSSSVELVCYLRIATPFQFIFFSFWTAQQLGPSSRTPAQKSRTRAKQTPISLWSTKRLWRTQLLTMAHGIIHTSHGECWPQTAVLSFLAKTFEKGWLILWFWKRCCCMSELKVKRCFLLSRDYATSQQTLNDLTDDPSWPKFHQNTERVSVLNLDV